MIKKPGQSGQNAIWDGPLSEKGRSLAPGNSRNNMKVLQAPCKYKPGPITMKTYKNQMSSGIPGLKSMK